MCIFGLFKQVPSPVILINLIPHIYNPGANYEKLIPELLKDYSCVCEELDNKLPKHLVRGLRLPS